MNYRFTVKYVPNTHHQDPEPDLSCSCETMIVERSAHETVPIEILRQQVAFELEEQHYRVLSIEGEAIG